MKRNSIVLVHVTYDHFRFQENVGAATGIQQARKLAKQFDPALPVIESKAESEALDDSEAKHIFIEKLANDKLAK